MKDIIRFAWEKITYTRDPIRVTAGEDLSEMGFMATRSRQPKNDPAATFVVTREELYRHMDRTTQRRRDRLRSTEGILIAALVLLTLAYGAVIYCGYTGLVGPYTQETSMKHWAISSLVIVFFISSCINKVRRLDASVYALLVQVQTSPF